MACTEQVLRFDCEGQPLLGVLSLPPAPAQTAVLIVVGGPQYRAGSHRQFVLLARSLAAGGIAALRFDVRGMGDSGGAQRSFEALDADIGAAIDALLAAVPGVHRIALWGLCDGASAALMYCHATRDARIGALCLANPWVRSEATLARTHVKHYYFERLRQRAFWTKLLSGQIALGAVAGLFRNLRLAWQKPATTGKAVSMPFQKRMAVGWRAFPGDILLLLSSDDHTAKEFLEVATTDPEWRGALQRAGVERRDLDGADHTFSEDDARQQVEALTLSWLKRTLSPGSQRLLGAPRC